MPTYLYHCEKCQKEFEAEHSINDELQECSTCKQNGLSIKPKKLIAGGSSFILIGGGWAKDQYK